MLELSASTRTRRSGLLQKLGKVTSDRPKLLPHRRVWIVRHNNSNPYTCNNECSHCNFTTRFAMSATVASPRGLAPPGTRRAGSYCRRIGRGTCGCVAGPRPLAAAGGRSLCVNCLHLILLY